MKVKSIVDKRASSAKGEDKAHYMFLSHEIGKEISK